MSVKPLSKKITKFARECDAVYDLSIMMKPAHPQMDEHGLFSMLSGCSNSRDRLT